MKSLTAILVAISSSFAMGANRIDETFTATFSDYGKLGQVLSCQPGYDGSYATPDTLILRVGAIDLGLTIDGMATFQAYDHHGIRHHGGGAHRRPWKNGCGPAIARFEKAIENLDTVTVNVHRTVSDSAGGIAHRVTRNRKGDVISITTLSQELRFEYIVVELAGLEFTFGQFVNGEATVR